MLSEIKELQEVGEHPHIILVGKPPRSAKNPSAPFVGSRAYKTLLSWIAQLDVNTYNMKIVNIAEEFTPMDVKSYAESRGVIIALGDNASTFLDNLQVKYFKLPDPTKPKGFRELKNDCKAYIYSK